MVSRLSTSVSSPNDSSSDSIANLFMTDTPFSVSSVAYDVENVECRLTGIDSNKGQAAAPVIANGGQVGPPQVIISIICHYVY